MYRRKQWQNILACTAAAGGGCTDYLRSHLQPCTYNKCIPKISTHGMGLCSSPLLACTAAAGGGCTDCLLSHLERCIYNKCIQKTSAHGMGLCSSPSLQLPCTSTWSSGASRDCGNATRCKTGCVQGLPVQVLSTGVAELQAQVNDWVVHLKRHDRPQRWAVLAGTAELRCLCFGGEQPLSNFDNLLSSLTMCFAYHGIYALVLAQQILDGYALSALCECTVKVYPRSS